MPKDKKPSRFTQVFHEVAYEIGGYGAAAMRFLGWAYLPILGAAVWYTWAGSQRLEQEALEAAQYQARAQAYNEHLQNYGVNPEDLPSNN